MHSYLTDVLLSRRGGLNGYHAALSRLLVKRPPRRSLPR